MCGEVQSFSLVFVKHQSYAIVEELRNKKNKRASKKPSKRGPVGKFLLNGQFTAEHKKQLAEQVRFEFLKKFSSSQILICCTMKKTKSNSVESRNIKIDFIAFRDRKWNNVFVFFEAKNSYDLQNFRQSAEYGRVKWNLTQIFLISRVSRDKTWPWLRSETTKKKFATSQRFAFFSLFFLAWKCFTSQISFLRFALINEMVEGFVEREAKKKFVCLEMIKFQRFFREFLEFEVRMKTWNENERSWNFNRNFS